MPHDTSGADFRPGVDVRTVRIGIMPLVDAAPIIVAERLGFFAEQGLEVILSRERAWASVRDKLAAGLLDAAQLLAPMPLSTTLGLDAIKVPLVSAMVLNRNGNAITVSAALHKRLLERIGDSSHARTAASDTPVNGSKAYGWAAALRHVLAADRAAARPPLTLAHVFPFSSHAYQLRYWLAAAEIHPDHDINLMVVPPPLMVEQLATGRIDGFCVGAPWGDVSMERQQGITIVQSSEIWPNSPEKVLGVTRQWADRHPQTYTMLIVALLQATRWLGNEANLDNAARLLAADGILDVSIPTLRNGLARMRFDGAQCQRLWPSEVMWIGTQMQRWGQAGADIDLASAADRVCSASIYAAAAQQCGVPVTPQPSRIEGPWFDGVVYDASKHDRRAPG